MKALQLVFATKTSMTYSLGEQVEKGAIVAAGSVVQADTVIPSGQLWASRPAKYLREEKTEEKTFFPVSADVYSKLAGEHETEAQKKPPF